LEIGESEGTMKLKLNERLPEHIPEQLRMDMFRHFAHHNGTDKREKSYLDMFLAILELDEQGFKIMQDTLARLENMGYRDKYFVPRDKWVDREAGDIIQFPQVQGG